MVNYSRYCVPFRRRREGKTDYKARKALVLSGKPRLVVRKTNRNILAQIIIAKPKGDEVLVAAHSNELIKYGWTFNRTNIPADYLTGLLVGLKAKAKGLQEAILDIGLSSPSKGSGIFALLKGILDADISVPHSEEKLPSENRITGEHIKKYVTSLNSNAENSNFAFSKYKKNKILPEKLTEQFENVKNNIIKAYSKVGVKKT